MAFLDFLFGQSGQQQQFNRYTPQQESMLDQLLQQSMGQLNSDEYSFDPIADQARTGFYEDTVPTLAERFTSMGEGGQRSSAFQGSLGQAGAGLEQSLAGLRSQYNLGNRSNLNQRLGMGLSPRYENAYRQSSPGFLQAGAGSVMNMLPYLLSM